MKSLFITFEGTEGCGKSTQIELLAQRLRALGHRVRTLREPGGTPVGEEIRHTFKHSHANVNMTYEAELLLMNASRAQIVREVIRPALAVGEIVLCDRFTIPPSPIKATDADWIWRWSRASPTSPWARRGRT